MINTTGKKMAKSIELKSILFLLLQYNNLFEFSFAKNPILKLKYLFKGKLQLKKYEKLLKFFKEKIKLKTKKVTYDEFIKEVYK